MNILPSFNAWFDAHHAGLDALVLDVDGILLLVGKPVPGSLDLMARLRALRFPFGILTNDGNHSVAEKRMHLQRCGFDIQEQEITSCADGLVDLAAARRLHGKRFFIAGDLGNPNFAAQAGLRYTRSLAELPRCDGVIIGESHYNWEPVLNGLINYVIRHPDRPFIVPNPDEYYPAKNGTIRVAAGGTARFIQRVAEQHGVATQPIYLGKPYRPIFEHNHRQMERRLRRKLNPGRILMLGDSLASDVRGASAFGYRTALLLTGVTTASKVRHSELQPDLVFKSF